MNKLFGDSFEQIILFGSYAWGTQDEESDIDIMILVNLDKSEINTYFESVMAIVNNYDLEYDIVLSPIIQSKKEYDEYKEILPFFKNVGKGVQISA